MFTLTVFVHHVFAVALAPGTTTPVMISSPAQKKLPSTASQTLKSTKKQILPLHETIYLYKSFSKLAVFLYRHDWTTTPASFRLSFLKNLILQGSWRMASTWIAESQETKCFESTNSLKAFDFLKIARLEQFLYLDTRYQKTGFRK